MIHQLISIGVAMTVLISAGTGTNAAGNGTAGNAPPGNGGQPIGGSATSGTTGNPPSVSTPIPGGLTPAPAPTPVGGAPGMTRDLEILSPPGNNPGQPHSSEALQGFVGHGLTVKVLRSSITFCGLTGVEIEAGNDTDRPWVMDGEKASVSSGGQTYKAISLRDLQLAIQPPMDLHRAVKAIFLEGVPAAVTVGLVPTIKDIRHMKLPIEERYGDDEERRRTEAARFGDRILWPGEKTQGILFMQNGETFSAASVAMPVHALFDNKETACINSTQ